MAKAVRNRARSAVLTAGLTLAALTAGLAEQYARPEPGRLTLIALGSSRTMSAFHPPTAAAGVTAATGRPCLAFNTALPGSGPLAQLLHLRRLMACGIRPDLVVVEITPVMCARSEANF